MATERKLTGVFAEHQSAHQRQHESKTAVALISLLKCSAMLNVSLPLIDYVAFFPDCPSAPSLPQGGHAWKYDKLGGLWHPGIVAASLSPLCHSSSPNIRLSVTKVCIKSFPSSLSRSPAVRHIHPEPTYWDQTRRMFCGVTPSRPPSNTLGNAPRVRLNFPTGQQHNVISDDSVPACLAHCCAAMLP